MAVKAQLQRLLLVIRKIQSHPYIGFEELTQELERELTIRGYNAICSRTTLQRDIKEIRDDFYINIQYSRLQGGYFIDQTEQLEPDVETLLEPFELLNSLNTDSGKPDFIYPEKHRPKGIKHLFTLIQAIKTASFINFSYCKYANEDFSIRQLAPYALKEFCGRWYIIGKEKENIRTFGLDRMESLTILSTHFPKDPVFNMEEKFRDCYGIYSSEEYPVEEIILSFGAEDGNYLKSVPLHASQEILKDTPEEFIIKLRIRLTLDFLMEIISRSWSLKVISPPVLRETVCGIYRSALKRNYIDLQDE